MVVPTNCCKNKMRFFTKKMYTGKYVYSFCIANGGTTAEFAISSYYLIKWQMREKRGEKMIKCHGPITYQMLRVGCF